MNVEDLTNWAMAHKLPKGMVNMSKDQIRDYLLCCYAEGRLVVDFIGEEITGYVTYRKTIHVEEIQTSCRNSFRKLILFLGQQFPGYRAEAIRRGKIKTYNVSQLINKI